MISLLIASAPAPPAVARPRQAFHAKVAPRPVAIWAGIALLTLAVLLVHGWHPWADDAGIYDAGILHLMHPELYRPDAQFVAAHTHLSLFAHVLAALAAWTHLPLPLLLLVTHLVSIVLFLLACRAVAQRLFARTAEVWCATALAAACFTLPIAGTSLFLMDPYVTARSFSTPLSLFALAAILGHRWGRAALLLVLAILLHPLMGLYAVTFLALLALVELGFPRGAILLAAEYVTGALILFLISLRTHATAAYHQAVGSRVYLLPSRWEPWEWLGLVMPVILFLLAARNSQVSPGIRRLCGTAVLSAVTFVALSVLFVHPAGSMLLVRLQPLRSFHLLYAIGVLLLGGLLGHVSFSSVHGRRARAMAFILVAVVASIFYQSQRSTMPFSAHIEWPGLKPRNPWSQAFLWIAHNTPRDAVFASDPDLVLLPGEDTQSFRAAARRSLLADYKDEGVAVVFPELADSWHRQYAAQEGIESMTDAERLARLRPFGVQWLLLPIHTPTGFDCPYRNIAAQVCRLP
ncbi:DUF6798 domain-containing protein [Silvibacterium sp.]|uniref:DUF6798 domain-containing protein n=1 Tax=Silvibacterium sp. TaxID=1964179 RepID=UPI0039E57747